MVVQKHRTPVLLEPEQHKALVSNPQHEKRSIFAIVRRIVGRFLQERTKQAERRRAIHALERLTHLRKRIEGRSGVYRGDLIAEVRTGREEQMERGGVERISENRG